MIPYGHSHPSLVDDRLPMVLVVFDGLGDRPSAQLDFQTPAEAAATPNLDALALRGASGVHFPLGPGRAPASEISHWAMFGYGRLPFPGRAVLEARGHGHTLSAGIVYSYGALRTSEERAGSIWVTGRATSDDASDAVELLSSLDGFSDSGLEFRFRHLVRGEALLAISGRASPEITDSDPLFEHVHPWLRPLALEEAEDPAAAERTAAAMEALLRHSRTLLSDHPVNDRRRWRSAPALDVLTTKWTGTLRDVPTFEQRVGTPGAAVTSSALYAGMAKTLDMAATHIAPTADVGADLAERFDAAARLIDAGSGFVHIHTKATDDAGHTKNPKRKLRVLEELDEACSLLAEEPFRSAVVAITGDHATPSVDGVLHSGDPTPLTVAGPTVRPDAIEQFGELFAADGSLGRVTARDVLPLMLGYANRPMFLGTRVTRHESLGLPDNPLPMDAG